MEEIIKSLIDPSKINDSSENLFGNGEILENVENGQEYDQLLEEQERKKHRLYFDLEGEDDDEENLQGNKFLTPNSISSLI